jgi:hypothetical protein
VDWGADGDPVRGIDGCVDLVRGNGGRVVRSGCLVSRGTGSVVTVQSPSMVSENLSEKACQGVPNTNMGLCVQLK